MNEEPGATSICFAAPTVVTMSARHGADWAQHFLIITDAIDVERQIKSWSRAKKEALIRGDYGAIQVLSKRKKPYATP